MVKLHVKFVKFHGEILAVFMRSSANIGYRGYPHKMWMRDCYTHTGQHGECYDGAQRRKEATLEEYTPLANELKSLGYELNILNKN